MESYDVIVLGGGIAGACAARSLVLGREFSGTGRRDARRIALVEARVPGHPRGSSHGDGRIVRFTYPEAAYLAMAKESYRGWADIEREGNVRLLETTGGWECADAESSILRELTDGMASAGIAFESLDAAESRRRFPHFAIDDDHRVLFQRDGAVVRADRAVKALWQIVARAGARVLTESPVTAVEPRGDRIRVRGEGFELEAKALVVAAGGWSRELLLPLGLDLPLAVTRETVAYFPKKKDAPSVGIGEFPTVVDYDGERVFYALPQIDVPGVKVGLHHGGEFADPSREGCADPRTLERIVDYVRRRLPHLETRPVQTTTCLYTNTPDYHFVLDRHPELSQIVIGTGFSGHGFKFGPVIGEILAQLATGGSSPVDLDLFRIARFREADLRPRSGA